MDHGKQNMGTGSIKKLMEQMVIPALSQVKISFLMACLRKIVLLIPLIILLPLFSQNKLLAVFLAEPVLGIIAAAATTISFFIFFRKLIKEGKVNRIPFPSCMNPYRRGRFMLQSRSISVTITERGR